jgi:hypothetical protein
VVSLPADLRGLSGRTGRSSSPRAMAWKCAAEALPKCSWRKASGRSRRSLPVRIPSRSILAAVAGPTPWKSETSNASTKAGPISGVMTNCPFGLRWPEASFARNLLWDTPAEAVRPVRSRIRARISLATRTAVGTPFRFSVTSR